MANENGKKSIDVEKAKKMAKSPKGKIGAIVSVVIILAAIGVFFFVWNDKRRKKVIAK